MDLLLVGDQVLLVVEKHGFGLSQDVYWDLFGAGLVLGLWSEVGLLVGGLGGGVRVQGEVLVVEVFGEFYRGQVQFLVCYAHDQDHLVA